MTIITPYLPKFAELAINEHYKSTKQPAFLKAVDLNPNYTCYCQNCAGLGMIFVQFAEKGPFHEIPMTRKAITYFEGDGVSGKGWYIIEKTENFTCPHCKGESRVAVEPAKQPIDSDRKYHKPQSIDRELKRMKVTA